jgi:choloylglycine hydrolase
MKKDKGDDFMCTAISARGAWHLFGRTLDLEKSYQEQVMLLPRRAGLQFLREKAQRTHYAILGMALQNGPHTLFFDAVNEHGLCIAALNFPGEANYHVEEGKKHALASYELIPWLLGRCRTVSEAKALLRDQRVRENFALVAAIVMVVLLGILFYEKVIDVVERIYWRFKK